MFNPAELEIVNRDDRPYEPGLGSFVGIRRTSDGKRAFHLPPGFDAFPAGDADAVNGVFFSLFKTLRSFQDRSGRVQSNEYDGSSHKEGGAAIVTSGEESATLYSKIPMLEAILDSYDELRIFVLVQRQRRTDQIDYSHIHRYLHEAVYLDDNVAFVDEMVLPRPVVELTVTDLVQMFCFVYSEVKRALSESVSAEVNAQAHIFKAKHLYPDSLLFSDTETHTRTVQLLKDKLYEIDRQAGYKDADFWHFYSALEAFLYGDLEPSPDGTYWGVSRFALVWEDMCLVYVWRNAREGVLYADAPRYSNTKLGGHHLYVHPDFEPPFYFEFHGEKRYMRPDLVRHDAHSEGKGGEAYVRRVLQASWPKKSTCIISVSERTPEAKECFRKVANKLKRKGFREIRGWRGTFPYVTRGQYDSAVAAVAGTYQSSASNYWRVVDFKCVPLSTYEGGRRLGTKATRDVHKQITYEYALLLQGKGPTRSELCIPHFVSGPPGDLVEKVAVERLHEDLREQEVEVQLIDFDQVQHAYLEESQEEAYEKPSEWLRAPGIVPGRRGKTPAV